MSLTRIMEDLSALTVVEAVQLTKQLEERWGVKAVKPAPVVIEPHIIKKEPTEFNVVLTASGPNRIPVVREVREMTGCKLLDARNLVSNVPSVLLEALSEKDAEDARARLAALGAEIEVRGVEVP